jgi:hypothetical protein
MISACSEITPKGQFRCSLMAAGNRSWEFGVPTPGQVRFTSRIMVSFLQQNFGRGGADAGAQADDPL